MPLEQLKWSRRIKSVESEHAATRLAIDRLQADAKRDSKILANDLKVRDVASASANLEGTYIVRIFAEFESGLRQFWSTMRTTEPPVRDLIDGIGAKCRIPNDIIANVHLVREYRNGLVHERDDPLQPIPIAASRGRLCHFMSRLPNNW